MQRKLMLLTWLFLHIAGNTLADSVHIIPEPVHIEQRTGSFILNEQVSIYINSADPEAAQIAGDFAKEFFNASGMSLHCIVVRNNVPVTGRGLLVKLSKEQGLPKEGYVLDIGKDQIGIIAADLPGLFYAFQSLRQLLPPELYRARTDGAGVHWQIPCARITDYPRYPYRGMHLDVSRHFFSVNEVKRYIDLLARFKLNIFHWHLTDSNGWRIEIKQYPRLTGIGAWRADRKGVPFTIAMPTAPNEPATYGGYYTRQQIMDVIAYAQQKYITIIPEIEMPGHCTAALVAYPQYACLNNQVPLQIPCGYPGDLQHNFCVGYDSTFTFLQNILSEVMDLFPGEYIHIGGDEVRKEPWLNCPRCRQRMKREGLSNTKQLQAYFTHRIDSFITAKGKRLIGWDEITEAGISPNATVMSWRGEEGGKAAVLAGHDAVMAPYRYVYFDLYQSDPALEPAISYAPVFLDTVYSFNPTPAAFTPEQARHIQGGEACLWTENIPSVAHLQYMLLPRMLALAEVLWTPLERKDYVRFIDKTEEHLRRFELGGIHYARSLYNVHIAPSYDTQRQAVTVALTNQARKYEIRYTTNGRPPHAGSLLYSAPLVLRSSAVVKAATFYKGQLMGKINEAAFSLHKAAGRPIKVSRVVSAGEGTDSAYRQLSDGIYGTVDPGDRRWIAFNDSLVMMTIDLGQVTTLHTITMQFLEDQVGSIFQPKALSFELSQNGADYNSIYQKTNARLPMGKLRHTVSYRKSNINRQARYVRVIFRNAGLFPGNPEKNLLFTDEVVIR